MQPTTNLTPLQRHMARRGALAMVQQEINKRLTRYLWTAHSEPSSITRQLPQGGLQVTYARKNVEGGIIPRCMVTPVVTADYLYRSDLVPEGMRGRDRMVQGNNPKVTYFAVDEFAGDVTGQLLRDHGALGDRATNSGLIELAPDRLPHLLDEEVEALRIDEVFFGPQMIIPVRNVDVLAAIEKQQGLLVDRTHWICEQVDARGLELLERIGEQLRAAVRTTHLWQENVCRRANIALTCASDDEQFKLQYDELDELCFERTGSKKVESAQRSIGEATIQNSMSAAVSAATVAGPVPVAAPKSATQDQVLASLAQSQAMLAQVMQQAMGGISQLNARFDALEAEAEAPAPTPASTEPVPPATPPRGNAGRFTKQDGK